MSLDIAIIYPMPFFTTKSLVSTLNELYELLTHNNYHGYIVGGFIRDWLLNRQTNDVDIAVDGNAIAIARDAANAFGGKFVLLDKANNIARVVIEKEQQWNSPQDQRSLREEWHLDFSSFSGDIESDLNRRDFTINAMATELGQFISQEPQSNQSQLKFFDPFSGEKDLRDGIIRAVSEQIFEADASRLLRAVRLAAELDLTIEPETKNLIRLHSYNITKVAGERVREELLRLLSLPRSAYYLRYLDDLGLLLALIPELADSKGVDQPTVHFWDVFDHSLQTVAAIEFLLRESQWDLAVQDLLATVPWSDTIEEHLSQEVSSGGTRKALLKLGGLLHDIAKPRTKSVDDTGRAYFLGHAKEGAAIAVAILERLRFSNREISLVESLVYHHLRPAQMSDKELPTQRAIYRYFRDTGDAGIDILFLALADYLASRGPLVDIEEWKKHCQLINYILIEHEKQQFKVLPVKLADGHDLIEIFGLTQGPLIGELLSVVREAQASGELANREEAIALVQKELYRRGKGRNMTKGETLSSPSLIRRGT